MATAWEVDWAHPGNEGQQVWARNPLSHVASAREWHWTKTHHLRECGVQTPTYRADAWEVDWSKRNGKRVWARNPESKMPGARDWHWVDFHTLENQGIKWRPKALKTGRSINSAGYVVLYRPALTEARIALAERFDLFLGKKRSFLIEHRLVAVEKYGYLPDVVRHKNGVKHDNDPDNLVAGTTQENTMDHNTARLAAMVWRERAEIAEMRVAELEAALRLKGVWRDE